MSYTSYDTQDRKHRSDRHRDRDSRRDRPSYKEEEIVETRTGPRQSHQMDLVRRREDSVEEVERDFPPGDGYVQRRSTRRARSDGRGRYDDDDYYEDRRTSRRYDGKKSHRRRDYSSSSSSESPPRNRRRKSLGEQALAALGIGGALGAATGHRSRSRDRGRGDSRHRRHRSYSSSRSPSGDRSKKIQQALKAAVTAGATEAFRSRKEPGGWGGAKGRRVLTAAIGAGGIDGLVNNKDPDKKGTRHTLEAVIGGLASNHILNGPREKNASRSRSRSRVRSRARSRGGGGGRLKELAAGGLAAAAGKALLDSRNRSKSRGRRSYSSDSDSRSPRRSKKRSKSVSDYVSQGIAALGLGEGGKDKRGDDRRGSRRDRYDPHYEDDYRGPPQGRLRGGGGEGGEGIPVDSDSDSHSHSHSSSDDISSAEEERTEKKMRGKEFLTAGLASVATIHAAHSVYKSVDNRKKRSKLVKKGEMSPEESRKLKNKARLQDAAAVGIAALGIKGAVSEWKEMNEQRVELREFSNKRVERHEKRLHKLEEKMARNDRRSTPNLNQQFYESGPRYQDGNPYHTGSVLPPPPMGPQQAQYH